ncbi:hypothetical protein AvCA_27120 [Azotobacter vinelandii CA]|uniref:Uncharacterized protein n=2 Tax=Azotobacter vinelandii TaxID=354 RepID=C1DJW7_AZOVD|nr:hypothetical protein Avin_27120 [Azotobacter vinelandii DJ]AGK14867.1 hypothetical protein AvCA_27120 [Azotobacter vinelandii CA]AGK20832.1 hypothetical protein AvCA6_27120 [Azotobacter vinelandii CA6]
MAAAAPSGRPACLSDLQKHGGRPLRFSSLDGLRAASRNRQRSAGPNLEPDGEHGSARVWRRPGSLRRRGHRAMPGSPTVPAVRNRKKPMIVQL